MTLYETIKYLEKIALRQKSVESAGNGNIYEYMENPELKYGVFFITQNAHKTENQANHFNLNLFYVDRLIHSINADNSLQIQSIGKEVIENIIRTFCDELEGDTGYTITFQPFVQRFADECAGIYAVVELIVDQDMVCPE